MLVAEGYPRFILTEDILDEKARKRKEKQDAKAAGKAVALGEKSGRTFENAVKACALKDIILRWMSIMQAQKKGRTYFYRPVASLKTGHKGTVAK